MAFTLKKHTSNQLESARLNDVNDNWGDIEQAIDILQTNASLLWQGDSASTLQDIINTGYMALPNTVVRSARIQRGPDGYGATVYKSNNLYGAVFVFNYSSTFGAELWQLRNGTWYNTKIC